MRPVIEPDSQDLSGPRPGRAHGCIGDARIVGDAGGHRGRQRVEGAGFQHSHQFGGRAGQHLVDPRKAAVADSDTRDRVVVEQDSA